MAADDTQYQIGDNDNNILRKLLQGLKTGVFNIGTSGGGGGGGGGAVTVADGADVTQGAKGDAANTDSTSSWSVVSLLKGIWAKLNGGVAVTGTLTAVTSITNPVTVAQATAANLKTDLSGSGALANVTTVGTITNPVTVAQATAANLKTDLSGSGALANVTTVGTITNPVTVAQATAANLKVDLSGSGALGTVTNVTTVATVSTLTAGNVGGFTVGVKDTTAVSISPAYTSGDAVGAKRTITGALRTSNGSGVLESIQILDRANQKAAFDIYIFDANPTNATITDNAAFVFSTDDLKVIAHISVAAADYVTTNSKAVATKGGLGVALKGADSSTSLYAAIVTTSTPTYAATTDLQVIWGILQD
jgi:hypothetical protein